jgi:hypothetical protein
LILVIRYGIFQFGFAFVDEESFLIYDLSRLFDDIIKGRKFTIRIQEAPERGCTGQCMETFWCNK